MGATLISVPFEILRVANTTHFWRSYDKGGQGNKSLSGRKPMKHVSRQPYGHRRMSFKSKVLSRKKYEGILAKLCYIERVVSVVDIYRSLFIKTTLLENISRVLSYSFILHIFTICSRF